MITSGKSKGTWACRTEVGTDEPAGSALAGPQRTPEQDLH
jgi:hypothetical protein